MLCLQALSAVHGKPGSSLFIADTHTRQEKFLSSLPFVNCYVAAQLMSYAHSNNLNLSEVLAACKDATVVSCLVCPGLAFPQADTLVKGLHSEFLWEANPIQAAPEDIEVEGGTRPGALDVSDADDQEIQQWVEPSHTSVSSRQLNGIPVEAEAFMQPSQDDLKLQQKSALALDGQLKTPQNRLLVKTRSGMLHQQMPFMEAEGRHAMLGSKGVECLEHSKSPFTGANTERPWSDLDAFDTQHRGIRPQSGGCDWSCPVNNSSLGQGLQSKRHHEVNTGLKWTDKASAPLRQRHKRRKLVPNFTNSENQNNNGVEQWLKHHVAPTISGTKHDMPAGVLADFLDVPGCHEEQGTVGTSHCKGSNAPMHNRTNSNLTRKHARAGDKPKWNHKGSPHEFERLANDVLTVSSSSDISQNLLTLTRCNGHGALPLPRDHPKTPLLQLQAAPSMSPDARQLHDILGYTWVRCF
jgi:hypothetical protein